MAESIEVGFPPCDQAGYSMFVVADVVTHWTQMAESIEVGIHPVTRLATPDS